MQRISAYLLFIALSVLLTTAAQAGKRKPRPRQAVRNQVIKTGEAETRLLEIYQLIGQASGRDALAKAENLVRDYPNFQLAQLVYGDLLTSRTRPLRTLGDVSEGAAKAGAEVLEDLRRESALRLKAQSDRPAPGTIPSQFLSLSRSSKHAIAIDTSRARLYLFENTGVGLRLVSDYYVSVGKSGVEKTLEGDMRTPLGVYYVTSNLDPKSLEDIYGAGALPISYPNPLDIKRGKTGSGIWLHGSPTAQFSRAPLSTNGCLALANPDLMRLVRTVEIRSTPVVIAQNLQWVAPQSTKAGTKSFEDALQRWHKARSGGDLATLTSLYTSDFDSYGKTLADWTAQLRTEATQMRGRSVQLKDLSYLRWTDKADTMVVTFGEVLAGSRTGHVRRQYWVHEGNQWKIFFESVIG